MIKKYGLGLCVCALVLTIIACGNKPDDSSGQSPSASVPVQTASGEADIKGYVTALDGDRALIVDRVPGDTESTNQPAVWVRFKAGELKDIRIGYEVKAWSNGAIAESYPMQTQGLKIEVVNADMTKVDAQGDITGVQIDEADATKSYVEIDGVKYVLMPITKVYRSDAAVEAKTLKVGDKVKAWFPGYSLMGEMQVTQVIAE